MQTSLSAINGIKITNIKYLKVLTAVIFSLLIIYLIINYVLPPVLKSFNFTEKEKSLDNFIKYQLPEGWGKEKRNPINETDNDSLSLISPDFGRNIPGGISRGANIRIYRQLKDSSKSTIENIKSNLPVPLKEEATKANPVSIGMGEGYNLFTCWEGCADEYFIEKSNYIWGISFICAPDCTTIKDLNMSKYAKDRDLFLNSVEFE